MTAYAKLLAIAERAPEQILIELRCGDGALQQITAAKAADDSRAVAAALARLGVRPGDAVGVMLPNVPQFVASHFGVLMAGGVFVPLNVLLTPGELSYQLNDSRIAVLVVYHTLLATVREAIKQAAGPVQVIVVGPSAEFLDYEQMIAPGGEGFTPVTPDPALPIMTLYTSGTTGKPKGAQISGANLAAMIEIFTDGVQLTAGDKFLCVLPLFHVFALNGVLHPALARGASLLLHPRFEATACIESLERDGPTHFAGVPTMYFYILQHPRVHEVRFPSLKYCISGGAGMPVETMRRFEEQFQVPVYEGYGLTEITVCGTLNCVGAKKFGSAGPVLPQIEVMIADAAGQPLSDGEIGEVAFRGPTVMLGYLNQPEATQQAIRNGWFFTGDLGYRDPEGFIFLVDRKKDMILKGGFNIYPREVEEVIYQRPEISEAAVIGVPDPALGEQVAAVVSFKPGCTVEVGELAAHLAAHLARYKLPRYWAVLPQLPKGPTGKLLKRELRSDWQSLTWHDVKS